MGPAPTPRTMTRPAIFTQLRSDHRVVLGQMNAVDRVLAIAHPPLSTAALESFVGFAAHLDRQFATHLIAEDEVLYPTLALRLTNGRALVEPLHVEHQELRDMLASFNVALASPTSAQRDEQLLVQIRDLVDLLRIHIRKEEALLFGVAERVLEPGDLAELDARRHRLEPTRGDDAASRSKRGTS